MSERATGVTQHTHRQNFGAQLGARLTTTKHSKNRIKKDETTTTQQEHRRKAATPTGKQHHQRHTRAARVVCSSAIRSRVGVLHQSAHAHACQQLRQRAVWLARVQHQHLQRRQRTPRRSSAESPDAVETASPSCAAADAPPDTARLAAPHRIKASKDVAEDGHQSLRTRPLHGCQVATRQPRRAALSRSSGARVLQRREPSQRLTLARPPAEE